MQSDQLCIDNLLSYIHNNVKADNERALADIKERDVVNPLKLVLDESQLYLMFTQLQNYIKLEVSPELTESANP